MADNQNNQFLPIDTGAQLASIGQPPAGVGSSTRPASFGGPVPPGQTPPPSVNPQVIYTDQSGKGYNPNELSDAWKNNATFRNDPANARVSDLLPQYHTVLGTPMAPTGSAASSPTSPILTAGGMGASSRNPMYDQLLQTLMKRIGTSLDVDPNDPLIQRQTDAYAADQTRGARNLLSGAAERVGPYGSTGVETRGAQEALGQQIASFRAALLQKERDARRGDITSSIGSASGLLTNEDQSRLQEINQGLDRDRFNADTAQTSWLDQYQALFGN